ncbi:MAG TPA: DNA-3-methyladenine glycosylase 2 family protein [Marinobacter sp.]|nr:DNA-3-methyladenine glycosylase 2 family protein [Marinobacter sp.]
MTTLLTPENLHFGARQLASTDPHLAAVHERLGTPPMWAREPGFATLVHIILEQQVSLKAARTMYLRLCDYLGEVTPQAVRKAGEPGLRSIGLTRQKARYCSALADRVCSGQLNLGQLVTLDDNEGRKTLLAVPGLGPWSVDIYYLMALRRQDIWPQGDLALAIALQEVKGLDAPATREEQIRFANSWSPWRSVAARMLWMHYLVARGDDPRQA